MNTRACPIERHRSARGAPEPLFSTIPMYRYFATSNGVSKAALLLTWTLAAVGCAGEGATLRDGEPGSQKQALLPNGGAWRGWDRVSDVFELDQIDHFVGNPAVCIGKTGGSDGMLVVGREPTTNGFLSASFWRSWVGGMPEPAGSYPPGYWLDAAGNVRKPRWQRLGDLMTFNDDPACSALDEPGFESSLNHQIVVAGKYKRNGAVSSNDDKYYVRTMIVDLTLENPYPGDDPEHATVVENWAKISDDQYESAPAIAVAGGALLVVGRRSDDRLYIHRNYLDLSNITAPYARYNWEPAIAVPDLPTAWVAQGRPQVVSTVALNGWTTIMVRAKSGAQQRLYYIMWNGNWFSGWVHLQTPGHAVYSDPGLEVDVGTSVDALDAMTVFFRGAKVTSGVYSDRHKVYQLSGTSFSPQSWSEVRLACPDASDVFPTDTSPSAVGSAELESRHVAVMRHSDNQFYKCTPVPGTPIGW